MSKKNVIIIGAAGRDFHNFNTYYRNNEAYTSLPLPPPKSRTSRVASIRPSLPEAFIRKVFPFTQKKIFQS